MSDLSTFETAAFKAQLQTGLDQWALHLQQLVSVFKVDSHGSGHDRRR